MKDYADPAAYWETRLTQQFDLTGVGYSLLGPYYNNRLYAARLQALERALAQANASLKGAHVLEVGCGSGFYTAYCAQQSVSSYTGLDITAVSVTNLRQQFPQFNFLQADISATNLNLAEKPDVVLIADVLFHIVEEKKFELAIKNMAGWLPTGGLLILSDIFPPKTSRIAAHFLGRSLEAYKHVLASQGLTILHLEPIFALLQPPPVVPGMTLPWKAYGWLWRYGWRVAKWPFLAKPLAKGLGFLDNHFMLPRFGQHAPNSKWLLAVKS